MINKSMLTLAIICITGIVSNTAYCTRNSKLKDLKQKHRVAIKKNQKQFKHIARPTSHQASLSLGKSALPIFLITMLTISSVSSVQAASNCCASPENMKACLVERLGQEKANIIIKAAEEGRLTNDEVCNF